MTSKRFQGHEQAAAKINYYDNGACELVSYITTVITIVHAVVRVLLSVGETVACG